MNDLTALRTEYIEAIRDREKAEYDLDEAQRDVSAAERRIEDARKAIETYVGRKLNKAELKRFAAVANDINETEAFRDAENADDYWIEPESVRFMRDNNACANKIAVVKSVYEGLGEREAMETARVLVGA